MSWIPKNTDARTWWLSAFIVAASVGVTSNLTSLLWVSLALLVLMASVDRGTERRQRWLFFAGLAVAVVAVRLLFRIVFTSGGMGVGQEVLLPLPTVELQTFGARVELLGAVTLQGVQAALTDGLRLAGIVLAFGLANVAADPRQLLRSAPAALHELATSVAIAINVTPELIESTRRVRKARSLRGEITGLRALPTILVPVLESAMDRSLGLAASMESRGFGRSGSMPRRQILANRLLMAASLALIGIASYLLLATALPVWVGAAVALASLVGFFAVFALSAKHQVRTRFVKKRLGRYDWVILGSTFIACSALILWGRT